MGEEMGNKFILASDASRHSQAISRQGEHLSMVWPATGISDAVWSTLTQPVTSTEAAILKLRSVKQRKSQSHLIKAQAETKQGNKQETR